jgi:hypothetical protein
MEKSMWRAKNSFIFSACISLALLSIARADDRVYGTIISFAENQITIRTKNGSSVVVDLTTADAVKLYLGENVAVTGEADAAGRVVARAVIRAKSPSTWPQ